MILLFILLLLGQPIWYFVFEVTALNLLLAYVLFRQNHVFDRLIDHLSKTNLSP